MGTYTTNYNLFMPSIGEQGWGDLVNGNFSTLDSTIKGLDTRVGTLETEGDAVAARVGTLESKVSSIENEVNGDLVCNSVTASGGLNGNLLVNVSSTDNNGVIGTYQVHFDSTSKTVNVSGLTKNVTKYGPEISVTNFTVSLIKGFRPNNKMFKISGTLKISGSKSYWEIYVYKNGSQIAYGSANPAATSLTLSYTTNVVIGDKITTKTIGDGNSPNATLTLTASGSGNVYLA